MTGENMDIIESSLKTILEHIEKIEQKIDSMQENRLKDVERITRLETKLDSVQTELTEFKRCEKEEGKSFSGDIARLKASQIKINAAAVVIITIIGLVARFV
jgi:chromosome segregation ATPase